MFLVHLGTLYVHPIFIIGGVDVLSMGYRTVRLNGGNDRSGVVVLFSNDLGERESDDKRRAGRGAGGGGGLLLLAMVTRTELGESCRRRPNSWTSTTDKDDVRVIFRPVAASVGGESLVL